MTNGGAKHFVHCNCIYAIPLTALNVMTQPLATTNNKKKYVNTYSKTHIHNHMRTHKHMHAQAAETVFYQMSLFQSINQSFFADSFHKWTCLKQIA